MISIRSRYGYYINQNFCFIECILHIRNYSIKNSFENAKTFSEFIWIYLFHSNCFNFAFECLFIIFLIESLYTSIVLINIYGVFVYRRDSLKARGLFRSFHPLFAVYEKLRIFFYIKCIWSIYVDVFIFCPSFWLTLYGMSCFSFLIKISAQWLGKFTSGFVLSCTENYTMEFRIKLLHHTSLFDVLLIWVKY